MVEALREHPRNPDQILIGYSRGLIVLWDVHNKRVSHHFLGSQVLMRAEIIGHEGGEPPSLQGSLKK